MERIMSQEERIRRAEEIYQKRKNQDIRINAGTNLKESEKYEISLFKNIALKIVICAIIYTCFYTIKNSNYFFSEDIMSKVNAVLSYDIDFNKIYKDVSEYISNLNRSSNDSGKENNNDIQNQGEGIKQIKDSEQRDDANEKENNEKTENYNEKLEKNNENLGDSINSQNAQEHKENSEVNEKQNEDQNKNEGENIEEIKDNPRCWWK